MITIPPTILPSDTRDPAAIRAALIVLAEHHHVITAGLAMLADFHRQFTEQGAAAAAATMADASDYLLDDRAVIDRQLAELAAIGGAAVGDWDEVSRAEIGRQLDTRESSRPLMDLAALYLRLAVQRARLDRLEAESAALAREACNAAA